MAVPEAAREWELVYDLDLTTPNGGRIDYGVDRSGALAGSDFNRVAYFLELGNGAGGVDWVWVAMDAFTDDPGKIGVPTSGSGAMWQTGVTGMEVRSNTERVRSGEGLVGNLEFWPHNYSPANEAGVAGADAGVFDFGDTPGEPRDGYGSMQVHDTAGKRTVFAFNRWKGGVGADLGIGNSDGQTRDWTFKGNAASYWHRRLRVFVRE